MGAEAFAQRFSAVGWNIAFEQGIQMILQRGSLALESSFMAWVQTDHWDQAACADHSVCGADEWRFETGRACQRPNSNRVVPRSPVAHPEFGGINRFDEFGSVRPVAMPSRLPGSDSIRPMNARSC